MSGHADHVDLTGRDLHKEQHVDPFEFPKSLFLNLMCGQGVGW